uniref:Uncharacterized protein n=1 Tax=Globodera rostochiensis TaxID=31243 RepID=A0A914HEW8_GLORO
MPTSWKDVTREISLIRISRTVMMRGWGSCCDGNFGGMSLVEELELAEQQQKMKEELDKAQLEQHQQQNIVEEPGMAVQHQQQNNMEELELVVQHHQQNNNSHTLTALLLVIYFFPSILGAIVGPLKSKNSLYCSVPVLFLFLFCSRGRNRTGTEQIGCSKISEQNRNRNRFKIVGTAKHWSGVNLVLLIEMHQRMA